MRNTRLRSVPAASSRPREGAPATAAPPPARARLPVAFRGQVVDARTGDPIAGARAALAAPLEILGRLFPPPPWRRRSSLADGQGRFELAAPAGETFRLLVHHPGHLPELVEVPAGRGEARIPLCRPSSIRGRLLDTRGAPVAGARVRASCPEAVDALSSVTSQDGVFHLEGLRPGRWLVAPDGAPGGDLAAAVVELCGGESALVVLAPRRCAPDPVC